jgi:FAD:protein FMN transferase
MRRALLPMTGLLVLAACRAPPASHIETLRVFGGDATLEIHAPSAAQARTAGTAVAQRLAAFDRDWHAWRPGALTSLNAAIARGESSIPPASLRDLILRAQPLSARSDGLFDPAVGGLMQLWGFHTDTFPVATPAPSAAAIDAWRERRVSIADVRVDGEQVASANRAVQLDFGAITEGVAALEASRILADHGVHHALLSLGGDVFAIGHAADREAWTAEIRDPYGGALARVALGDGEALFSSGNYNKFRAAPSGARWPHVLDPRTGQPVRGAAAVAVLHADPVLADVAATALMVGGPSRFAELLQRLDVHCALLVTEENEMMISPAMEARVLMLRDPVRLGDDFGTPGPCTR